MKTASTVNIIGSYYETKLSLIDGADTDVAGSYIDLVASKSGLGRIIIGDNQEYAYFGFTTVGVVTLHINSTNVVSTLVAGTNHLLIKDNGNNVRITNNLGNTLTATVVINYNS